MARYELNLRDYYRILRRHIIVISVISIGLGGMSFVLSMGADATWEAKATVLITQASDLTGMMLETFSWSSEDKRRGGISLPTSKARSQQRRQVYPA